MKCIKDRQARFKALKTTDSNQIRNGTEMTFLYIATGLILLYGILTLIMTYMVQKFPRRPVRDVPDWGNLKDLVIPSIDGGFLEVWVVEPPSPSRGKVVLAHGWSRNRDRMVSRARVFARMGFTAVLYSARDHGGSSPCSLMNAFRFTEDMESILKWLNEPVILYGHSLGAVAALTAAAKNRGLVKALFLEGCYAKTKEALLSIYRRYNLVFGILFGHAIVFWFDLFTKFRLEQSSPLFLASRVTIPVLLIHGEADKTFPLHHAWRLRDGFPGGTAELFVAPGADHSSSSLAKGFPEAIREFTDRHFHHKQ